MKPIFYLLLLLLFSCGNEKTIQLPSIHNAQVTEVHDVSAAYLFYDETQPDSVELNRKNLISTTNWLVNVDKRLTLEQAIPQIKLLQDKKRNAKMHQNEAAKNYFSCNDTSIKNLGFIEFTNVHYQMFENGLDALKKVIPKTSQMVLLSQASTITINSHDFSDIETALKTIKHQPLDLVLCFNKDMTFEDYITYKSRFNALEMDSISISSDEFIY
ncbi:hypothetical protein ACU8DI_09020 [Psychroserpens sp. BH13MA-6]